MEIIKLSKNVKIEKDEDGYKINIFNKGNFKETSDFIRKIDIYSIDKTMNIDRGEIKFGVMIERESHEYMEICENIIGLVYDISEKDADLIMKYFKDEFENKILKN